ncbi:MULTISPECIES: lactate utilization protein C [Winogradskyella]|uniref:LutC/YkgG family protein n=1 Tax=Winogradskyella TaxID=286104 RepID=UPI0015CDC873|nr:MULTISPECIES: LUD domain-containing protein [Winogradskyella]QXP78621.1 LUD domain-containing protein [Winogradskyella sp. HaHa_3_26]
MSSREHILSRAKANKPDLLELPNIDLNVFVDGRDLMKEFTTKVEVVGGNVVNALSKENIISQVISLFPDTKVNFSTLEGTQDFNTVSLEALNKPHELEDLDILILESNIGVAENGAIWLSDNQIPIRVLPFITKHLVLVLNKENIVSFMHQAYQKIASSETDFGVFISGPSKTADIEQSLVIGAQGALSLTVFIH